MARCCCLSQKSLRPLPNGGNGQTNSYGYRLQSLHQSVSQSVRCFSMRHRAARARLSAPRPCPPPRPHPAVSRTLCSSMSCRVEPGGGGGGDGDGGSKELSQYRYQRDPGIRASLSGGGRSNSFLAAECATRRPPPAGRARPGRRGAADCDEEGGFVREPRRSFSEKERVHGGRGPAQENGTDRQTEADARAHTHTRSVCRPKEERE